jgi:DNA-binding LacI/PurR family transcriptional regulator
MTGSDEVKRSSRKDVAARAGVSPPTVSRALNDHPSIPVTTRERIKRIARELGYVPSHIGRSHYQKKSYSLAAIIPYRKISGGIHSINNEHLTVFLYGAIQSASAEEYSVTVIADVGLSSEVLAELVLSRRVDALILLGCKVADHRPADLHALGIPFILIHHYVRHKPYLYIDSEPESGYRELFDYLASRGRPSLGFLGGGDQLIDALDRRKVVNKLAAEYGFPVSRVVEGNFTIQSGLAAAETFSTGPFPDVIVCANDNMAFGLMEGLKQRGVSIPADVGVTGFDDFELSGFISPRLTTIHNPFFDIGVEAGRLLLARLKGEDVASRKFPTNLIIRESA